MAIFEVQVTFYADDEVYGEELYFVRADSEKSAEDGALKLSEDSRFHDPRIDFTRGTTVQNEIENNFDLPTGSIIHDIEGLPFLRR